MTQGLGFPADETLAGPAKDTFPLSRDLAAKTYGK